MKQNYNILCISNELASFDEILAKNGNAQNESETDSEIILGRMGKVFLVFMYKTWSTHTGVDRLLVRIPSE